MKKLFVLVLVLVTLLTASAMAQTTGVKKELNGHFSWTLGSIDVAFDDHHRGAWGVDAVGLHISFLSVDDGRMLLGKVGLAWWGARGGNGGIALSVSPVCVRLLDVRKYDYGVSALYLSPAYQYSPSRTGHSRQTVGMQLTVAWH